MSNSAFYKLGAMWANHWGKILSLIAFVSFLVFSSKYVREFQTKPLPQVQQGNRPSVVAENPRIKACGAAMPERKASAAAEFKKKNIEAALSLMAYCDGLMPEGSAERSDYKKYLFAQEKVIDAKRAIEQKALKAEKKKRGVSIGMSQQEVLDSSWGRPTSVNTTTTRHGVRQQWVYGSGYLYFEDGILTSVQN